MTRTPEDAVRGLWAVLNDRDYDGIAAWVTDDCIYYDVPLGPAFSARGPVDIAKRLRVGWGELAAYENHDGTLQLVVYDVTADREAARVDVGDATGSGTFFPVALDGDTAYVQNGYEGGTYAVQWRDGTVSPQAASATSPRTTGRCAWKCSSTFSWRWCSHSRTAGSVATAARRPRALSSPSPASGRC